MKTVDFRLDARMIGEKTAAVPTILKALRELKEQAFGVGRLIRKNVVTASRMAQDR